MEKYAAEKFLDKIYGDLYLGIIEPVSSSGKTRIRPGDNRYDTIGRFLDKLDHISELSTTEHQKSHLLNLLYEKFVIKAENIPEPATDKECSAAGQHRGRGAGYALQYGPWFL